MRKRRRFAVRAAIVAGWVISVGATVQGQWVYPSSSDGSAEPVVYDVPFFPQAQYRAGIPVPDEHFGFVLGSRPTEHADVVAYLEKLAAATERVRFFEYGRTNEGRALVYVAISSEANMARLEEIRTSIALLGDPRKLEPQSAAERLIDETPAVAWMSYSIHGDELSSTDAAVAVAYHLSADESEATRRLRDGLVVLIDPVMNPDGRTRFVGQIRQANGRVLNPDVQALQHRGWWPWGRGNHYLFDMNRDWCALTQIESQARAGAILHWNPQLLVDSHEMGPMDTYLFTPAREPINPALSERLRHWWDVFARDHARAFDAYGWSYYTREWLEMWYPGYSDSWADLIGGIGILYEQAGVDGTAVRQRADTVLTYREAVHHHAVASLANLTTLLENRSEILRDFHERRRQACEPGTEREGRAFVFVLQPNEAAAREFTRTLAMQGIEVFRAMRPFTAAAVNLYGRRNEAREFDAGTFVIPMDQPLAPLAEAMLAFDPRMSKAFLDEERRELEKKRQSRLYDVTAWCMAMAANLDAYWIDGAERIEREPVGPWAPDGGVIQEGARYGYVLDSRSSDSVKAVARLLGLGVRIRAGEKDFNTGGRPWPRGSFLIRRHENGADLDAVLAGIGAETGARFFGVASALGAEGGPELGGRLFHLLEQPRIAVVATMPVSLTSYAATWHMLDARLGVRMSSLDASRVGRTDLRRYNVLVLPNAFNGEGLRATIGDGGWQAIGTWVRSGGTLIAMGRSAAMLANESAGLSQVRLRRDVLARLDAYAEAVQREKGAAKVDVDADALWAPAPQDRDEAAGTQPASATQPEPTTQPESESKEGAKSAPSGKADPEAMARQDEWQRVFAPQGTILHGRVDRDHWLCSGLGDSLPVFVSGDHALMSMHPVQTPVRLAERDRLRLSGLLWPEAAERLADTACVTVERVGRGQIILFHSEPNFRDYFYGSARLLENAILLGPGLGASPPLPW